MGLAFLNRGLPDDAEGILELSVSYGFELRLQMYKASRTIGCVMFPTLENAGMQLVYCVRTGPVLAGLPHQFCDETRLCSRIVRWPKYVLQLFDFREILLLQ